MGRKKLQMHEDCVGCKAEDHGMPVWYYYQCRLGYRTDRGKPLEPCPKPKTNAKFVRLYLSLKGDRAL